MAFSWIGLTAMLMLMLPSAAFFLFLPPKSVPEKTHLSKAWTVTEKAGQISCVIILVFTELRIVLNAWMLLFAFCLLVYYGLWIRYLAKGRGYSWLFAPLLKIPVPMAIFPVAAFGFAALWGQSIWLGVASGILAVGHITVSLHEYRKSIDV